LGLDEHGCASDRNPPTAALAAVWRVDAEKDGVAIPLLFKGTRAWDDIPFPLENEYRVMRVLQANSIPVPLLHGLCQYPKAIVMSWVKGGRDPGLVVEALENKSEISPDRWQASLRYMEILARMHSIDPAEFVAAGCEMPVGDAAKRLNLYQRFHAMYEDKKSTIRLSSFAHCGCAGTCRNIVRW
jgi:hypothetical protein